MEQKMYRLGVMTASALAVAIYGSIFADPKNGMAAIITIVAILLGAAMILVISRYEAPKLRWVFIVVAMVSILNGWLLIRDLPKVQSASGKGHAIIQLLFK